MPALPAGDGAWPDGRERYVDNRAPRPAIDSRRRAQPRQYRIAGGSTRRYNTDAAQSTGKIATDANTLGVDLLSIAGHKLYAPKGVGAWYIRRGVTLEPLIHGVGHKNGLRAATESALLIAALGEACRLARDLSGLERIRTLRDRLWDGLHEAFEDRVMLNGHPAQRLPNTLNVSFVGRIGSEVLAALDGVSASTGSACHAGRIELSSVLEAMGVGPNVGVGAVRFSLGHPRSDTDGPEAASARLGHASTHTTQRVYRRKPAKVTPLR